MTNAAAATELLRLILCNFRVRHKTPPILLRRRLQHRHRRRRNFDPDILPTGQILPEHFFLATATET